MSTQIKFTPEHYAILGKKGTGKSTLARYHMDRIQRDNPAVEALWTNSTVIGFNGTVHKIRYLRQLKNAGFHPKSGRYGIVSIDELSKAIPSRKVGHHNVELYNLIQEVMNRLRKRNCYFIYTDQWRRGADIMVRTNVDYVELPTLTKTDTNEKHGETPLFYYVIEPKGTEFSEMEDLQKNATLMHTEMNVSELFPKFITEEVIPLTYNPPFKVEQWSKSFMIWCAKHNYILKGMNASTVRNILDLYQIKKNAYITAREISAVLGKLKVDGMI
ncbi:MAG TPA: hypothetical protein VEP90_03755 [Methylomirabilota bacterium]|nr:hypothetical protein [Methylomirabilota bacterium]